jgi:hypothetical protein
MSVSGPQRQLLLSQGAPVLLHLSTHARACKQQINNFFLTALKCARAPFVSVAIKYPPTHVAHSVALSVLVYLKMDRVDKAEQAVKVSGQETRGGLS